jgi:hypothetical protein
MIPTNNYLVSTIPFYCAQEATEAVNKVMGSNTMQMDALKSFRVDVGISYSEVCPGSPAF